ncbi:MAG: hypothetical protein IJN48_00655 [Clostridia bacterium]|nr:hypothetical protein [Clostridia bacterium]
MKVKNIVTTVVFLLFIFGFFAASLIMPDSAYTDSERRELAQFPKITWDSVTDSSAIKGFDNYSVDQFPLRDSFRGLYSWYRLNVMKIGETNDLAVKDGYIAKVEPTLYEDSVNNAIDKFNNIYDLYLKDSGGKVYFSIVPDKNYFFSEKYGYVAMDYDRLEQMMKDGLSGMEYIDIFDSLELDDYYKTDTHWSQEKITDVAALIAEKLGVADKLGTEYETKTLYPFYGVYHAQTALGLPADTIYYLTNDILDACTVYDYETGKTTGIYDLEKFNSKEPYDTFLSGTRALLRIDNPSATTDKELVVFRDSFGSSLIPLIAEGYSSIYIVDIRYVASSLVGNYINFSGKDTLFLYSTLVLNSSTSLK